eukprot:TRINITY_DN33868_c0_g2_i1.p1 TRINITY_DN33868_c0_g2~~TRINITY_DN33868_c0_g2_i1.p1  ORF type:complete len:822 (+),score=265.87 TRINITY_DN33868_c0_g2_i1:195-2660(+)
MASQLARHVEGKIRRELAAEDRREHVRSGLRQDGIAAAHAVSNWRVDALRRQREDAAERRVLFTDYTYAQAEQEKEEQQQANEIQERLADELCKRKAAEAREEAYRQKIVASSDQLRLLKEKLKTAAMNKARAMQMVDRQAREEEDRDQEAHMAAYLEEQRLNALEKLAEQEREKAQQRGQVLLLQQQQVADKEVQRYHEGQEQLAKEKQDVEEVVSRIMEEDRQAQELQRKQQEERRMVMDFYRDQYREQIRAQDARDMELEQKNQEFMRRKREEVDRLAQEEASRKREKDKEVAAMVAEREDEFRKEEERRRILESLELEEQLERHRQREELEARKRREDIVARQRDQQEYLERKRQREQHREEEERRFREELAAKLANDDRIEQMSAQKRRMKLLEHRREVDRQVEERRKLYEAARQRELHEEQLKKEEEDRQAHIVEEERKKLLEEHAQPLRNFLPKGVLQNEAELAYLGGDFFPSDGGGDGGSNRRAASAAAAPGDRDRHGENTGLRLGLGGVSKERLKQAKPVDAAVTPLERPPQPAKWLKYGGGVGVPGGGNHAFQPAARPPSLPSAASGRDDDSLAGGASVGSGGGRQGGNPYGAVPRQRAPSPAAVTADRPPSARRDSVGGILTGDSPSASSQAPRRPATSGAARSASPSAAVGLSVEGGRPSTAARADSMRGILSGNGQNEARRPSSAVQRSSSRDAVAAPGRPSAASPGGMNGFVQSPHSSLGSRVPRGGDTPGGRSSSRGMGYDAEAHQAAGRPSSAAASRQRDRPSSVPPGMGIGVVGTGVGSANQPGGGRPPLRGSRGFAPPGRPAW